MRTRFSVLIPAFLFLASVVSGAPRREEVQVTARGIPVAYTVDVVVV
mgnify:FL=1